MTTTFAAAYPSFRTTRTLDDLHAREYPLLDALGHVDLNGRQPRAAVTR
jgi:hypothetical protein